MAYILIFTVLVPVRNAGFLLKFTGTGIVTEKFYWDYRDRDTNECP